MKKNKFSDVLINKLTGPAIVCVALAVSLFLTACGSTSSLQGPQGTVITPTRKFSKVTVQNFTSSGPEVGENLDKAKTYFPDRIATEIRRGGRFASVARNAKPDANTLVIRGVITKYEEGNPMMRFFIGMGAGSSFLEADVEFRSNKGATVGRIKVDKNSWALGGGIAAGQNPQSFMNGASDKIAEEAAKLAK